MVKYKKLFKNTMYMRAIPLIKFYSTSFLDFLCGDNQRKLASETAAFGWMWPVLTFILSDSRIL